ncbi:MAG: hypothetical protein ABI600_08395, partial [Luteolibacter sp.]
TPFNAELRNRRPAALFNNVKDIAVSPKDSARLYAIGPEVNGHWYSSQVFVSDDRGTTWRAAAMNGTRITASRRVNSIAADPNNRDTVYITVAGKPSEKGGVFRSTDAGETWKPMNDGLPDKALFRGEIWHVGREIAVSKNGVMVAIAHGASQVFTYDPVTSKWKNADAKVKQPNSVASDPFDPAHFLVAGLEGGLQASHDGGKTWTASGPEIGCHHVAFDQVKKGRIAVGSDDGIYLSEDSGQKWKRLESALPNRRGNSVAFAGDRILAGSTGAGVFWIPLTPAAAKPIVATTTKSENGSGGVEVIKNGHFEIPGIESKAPADWRLRWSDNKARVTTDTVTFKSQPGALLIQQDKAGNCDVDQELPYDLQGKWLSFTGQTRLSGEFQDASIVVQLMDGAGQQAAWITVFSPDKGISDWQSFKKTISIPKKYEKAFLVYHLKGSGDAWLDDISGTVSDPR